MSYADDHYMGNRTIALRITPSEPATNDASKVVARLQFFTKIKVLEARAIVLGTGYDEATASLLIYHDDTSIGAIVLTTETVGTMVDASLADTEIASTSSIEIQQTHATATGCCDLMIQYQEMFEAEA
jgi:hypothetical protein